ncbi:hypothetical protein ACLMJK_009497 [Lecanora helva]
MSGPIPHGRYHGRVFDKSLGNQQFGKAKVDCAFLASKSQWGLLGEDPAGLLRLALNFHEPDYKLSSAEIRLSFLPCDTGCPPNVTEHVYPEVLCGPPIAQQKSRNVSLEPSLGFSGVSFGGLGLHDTADWARTHRWHLRGCRLPDEQNSYTLVSWTWKANRLNAQNELIPAFQLAVVLMHQKPLIKVSLAIEGKIERGLWRGRFGKRVRKPQDVIELALCRQDVDFSAVVNGLAQEIIHLNTVPNPQKPNTDTPPFAQLNEGTSASANLSTNIASGISAI